MNRRIMSSTVVILALGLGAIVSAVKSSHPVLSATSAQTKQQYPVRGEVNRSFQLSPNAQIDVTGIEGAVKVETRNDNKAEIHFVRHARTQRDFDCETIVVQDLPSSLTIEHQRDSSCRVINAYEELTLVIPTSANLRLGRIEGAVAIGNTEGYLHLRAIEGSVSAGEVNAAHIEAIEGGVTLSIARLDSKGVTVRAVEGPVEIRVAESLNADLRVRATEGVDVDLPNVPNKRIGANAFQSEEEDSSRRGGTELQLGAGGAKISISSIEGRVRIRGL